MCSQPQIRIHIFGENLGDFKEPLNMEIIEKLLHMGWYYPTLTLCE